MSDLQKPTPKKAAFLAAYAKLGNVTSAAKVAKCDRPTVYVWRREDPGFATAMNEAAEEATEHLEAEARRRAVRGTLRPVFHQGEQCGVIREYSDTLLIFLLKGRKPETYRDNSKVEHSGGIGVEHSGGIAVRRAFDEMEAKYGPQLEQLARSRLGVDVARVHGSDPDVGKAESVPDAAPRNGNGHASNGHHPGKNGNGKSNGTNGHH